MGLSDTLQAPIRRTRYDLHRKHSVKRFDGKQPASDTMAIILIYQKNGILPSLIRQLEHFAAKGISCVIVANHPLSQLDRQQLESHTHFMVERPNLGYDFGGYREGILSLREAGLTPRNLFVLNDSVWFPLRSDCRLIDDALADPADVYGIFYNTKNVEENHRHLQSYFYRFGAGLLDNPEFDTFWKRLPLYGSKRQVVRRCEVKLTGYFRSLGCSVGARYRPEDVVAASDNLTDSEAKQVAAWHATTTLRGRSIFAKLAQMDPDTEAWPAARQKAFHDSRFRYYFIDAHPLILFRQIHSPFVKKSRELHFCAQRHALLQSDLHKDFEPHIRQEIETWDKVHLLGPAEHKDFQSVWEAALTRSAKSSGGAS